jgi:hypothetical protein
MVKGIEREAFCHAARCLTHITQQKWGAKLLSLSPSFCQNKAQSIS